MSWEQVGVMMCVILVFVNLYYTVCDLVMYLFFVYVHMHMNNFTCNYEVCHLPFVEALNACDFQGLHMECVLQIFNVDEVALKTSFKEH